MSKTFNDQILDFKHPDEVSYCQKCGFRVVGNRGEVLFWNRKRRPGIEDWMFDSGILQCRDEKSCSRRKRKNKNG